jgi:hypothetical protein
VLRALRRQELGGGRAVSLEAASPAGAAWSSSCWSFIATRSVTAPRRARRRGRPVLRRAERAPGRRRRAALQDDVRRPRLLLEPAGHTHGGRSTVSWPTSDATGSARSSSSGSTTPMSAMRVRHRWARAANTTSASSPDRDTRAPRCSWGLRPSRGTSPRPRRGTHRPSASGSTRRCPRATSDSSVTSLLAEALGRRWRFGVANAAPGTRDRRHLSSGDGASEPLLPGPDRLPVRRRHPSRRDPRGGAAGADRRVGVR